jgi:hypothetical protein
VHDVVSMLQSNIFHVAGRILHHYFSSRDLQRILKAYV